MSDQGTGRASAEATANRYRRGEDRDDLLADVAEMYYERGRTQAEIADTIGVTRSAVSRMLTEARERSIVEIRIQRPLRFDPGLEDRLVERFGLQAARVVVWNGKDNYDQLRQRLGLAAADALRHLLSPGITLGIAWGTTVAATIEAFHMDEPLPMKVVQLIGVIGASIPAYNAQALVDTMARKVSGEGVYLYAPFLVENADTVQALLRTPHIHEAIELGKRSDIALLGIGTTEPELSSLVLSGHLSRKDLQTLRKAGAVGDVCGQHYDQDGQPPDIRFDERLIGIPRPSLLAIPTRFGVAGGETKAPSVLGALRGGYVNWLVTDSRCASLILSLDGEEEPG
jgi:DNA-binding transcriptional regulator LsrR (DeoR family)